MPYFRNKNEKSWEFRRKMASWIVYIIEAVPKKGIKVHPRGDKKTKIYD